MDISPETSKSSPTRRRILGWGGAGMIGGLAGYWGVRHQPSETEIKASTAPPLPSAATPPESPPDSPASKTPSHTGEIRRDDFLPHLKSAFQLDSATRCTLVEVSAARKMISPTAEFTSFSLLFTAPTGFAADSKIYHLTHAKMGAMDLFLSPVGRSNEQLHLEAVCSQCA